MQTELFTTGEPAELAEAAMHRLADGFVSYYDTGAGVYLAWCSGDTLGMLADPGHIHIISQDGRRTLGEIETAARTVSAAADEIRREINTPGKPYGERAGLWPAA